MTPGPLGQTNCPSPPVGCYAGPVDVRAVMLAMLCVAACGDEGASEPSATTASASTTTADASQG